MAERKLTKAQKRALEHARDFGHAFARIAWRSRAGGAYSRMCDDLVRRGLLTKPPHELTHAGRSALQQHDALDKREERDRG